VQSVGWHANVRRILPLCAGALLLCSFAGCSASNRETAGGGAPRDPLEAVRNADLRAHFPAGSGGPSQNSKSSYEPLLFPGSDVEQAPARTPASDYRVASAEGVSLASGGGVEINFDRADIHAVAKTLLGDTLGINVVVDPRVQGTVTLAATGPIPRKDVLPVLESVLRMSNVAVVREGDLVKIVPVAEATGTGILAMGEGQPGFGVSVVPLRYVSAAAVARTAENFLARPGALKIDPARNLVLIQGTTAERQAALDVVSAFDVEWMRNQSVGLYPLKSTSPENMIKELERVFEAGEGGVGQGMVRFQPISRMNAVLVVSKNPKFLERATQWVQRLDRSDTSGTTVRVYRLKYGSAPQTAKILNEIFLAQRSGQTTRDTPGSQIAPGSSASQSRLDALTTANAGNSGSTPAQNGATTGATGNRVAGPIEAAFQNFDRKDRDSSNTTAGSSIGSSDTQNNGLFQNMRITADTADNSIVVYSNQEDYRVVERALREIDRPRMQVAIEATVAEVTLTDALQFGVQYFFRNSVDSKSVGFLPAAAPSAATTTPTTTDATGALQTAVQAAFIQRVLPGFNLLLGSEANPKVILSALSTITDVKVLSAPSVVVMDNQPALLQVGDEIPISTGTATLLSNSNTPVVSTIEMRNTGVILKVLPHVYSNGSIQMEIEQEISNVANSANPTLTPTISQRRVHSTIAVTSGQTVLLGGLIADQTQKTKSGLPILNEIPVIGNIFGNTSGQKQRTEIIMFIRPQLVRNSLDARQVAEDFRSSLQLMRAGDPIVPIGKAPAPVVIPLGKAAVAEPIGK
jgi:general secretion pathway protein D